MKKYEAMILVKPDLSEEERKALFASLHDVVSKNNGTVITGAVWQEKKKLFFPIKRMHEATYYLLNFSIDPLVVKEVKRLYGLNESVLRVLFTVQAN